VCAPAYTVLRRAQYCMGGVADHAICCSAMHLEGRQIARITCHICGRTVEIDPLALRGLRGGRLRRDLVCRACDARDADVSIRWECPPREQGLAAK